MPLDDLPGVIVVPTRQAQIDKWKRDHRIRRPDTDPADPSTDIDARVATDSLMPVHAASITIGNNTVLEQASGLAAVKKWGARYGVDGPRAAIGASGFVQVVASSGGTPLEEGDELLYETTGSSYKVASGYSATYQDGQHVSVIGVDTGPSTNLAPGIVLKWKSPRPGSGATVTVVDTNGLGLTGGREAESVDEYRDRIRTVIQNKPASGNDADYQATAAETPDVGIQAVFTWPAFAGTGTTMVTALLKPSKPGGSRLWNDTQRAAVESYVVGQMPVDDCATFVAVAETFATVVYKVTWDQDAAGWADLKPWPPYYPLTATGAPARIVCASSSDTLHFTLASSNNDYTNVAQPTAGTYVAFYDADRCVFAKKRIATVTGTGPWTVVCDAGNNASDNIYEPQPDVPVMPWSESLPSMLSPLLAYFDGLGPSEITTVFYDAGRRLHRSPPAPKQWPYILTEKGLSVALDIREIADGTVAEGDGVAPSQGIGGALAYILRLNTLAVYPE